MYNYASYVCVLLLGISSLDSASSQERVYKSGNVTIGGLTSLHRRKGTDGCGDFDVPALGVAEAIVFATDEINRKGNLLANISLGYDIRDSCQSPVLGAKHGYEFALLNEKATSSYENSLHTNGSSLFQPENIKGVLAVIGGQLSQTALVVSPLLQAVHLPLIESLATSEELSSVIYKDFLRTIPSDGNQAKAIAGIIKHYGWSYVAAIAEDDSYGRSGILALERTAMQLKFCLGITEFVPQGHYNRIPAIVYKLKQRKTVRVIVLWALHSTGKAILDEVAKQGLYDRTWIMSESLAMQQPDFLGVDLISKGHFLGVLPRRRIYSDFKAHIEYMTPSKSQGNPWWEEFWNTEYNCTTAKTDGTFTKCPESVRISNKNLNRLVSDFIPFVIDAVYTVAHALNSCMLDRCARELHLSVGSREFLERMRSMEFDGLTGRVGFDENGDPLNAVYDIVYVDIDEDSSGKVTARKATIGSWEKRRYPPLLLNKTSSTWQCTKNGGKGYSECSEECKPGERKAKTTQCCWECLRCLNGWITSTYGEFNCSKCPRFQKSNAARTACVDLPLINLQWRDTSALIIMAIGILGILLAVVICGIVIKYIDTPVVKASNPEISFILLLDAVSCFALIFLYLATPTNTLCRILQPLRYLSFTCCTAVLILKTMRIVQAFEMAPVRKLIKACIKSAPRQAMSLLAILFLDCLLAACWVIMDPPYLQKNLTQDGFIFLSCKNYRTTFGQALQLCMLVYQIALGLFCTYYAFRARKLPGNFNEAKYIAFSMYIFMLSWISYFPVGFAMQGWYVAIVSCTTAMVSSYGLLGCIFAPKIYLIFRHPEKNTRSAVQKELHTFSRVGTFNKSEDSST